MLVLVASILSLCLVPPGASMLSSLLGAARSVHAHISGAHTQISGVHLWRNAYISACPSVHAHFYIWCLFICHSRPCLSLSMLTSLLVSLSMPTSQIFSSVISVHAHISDLVLPVACACAQNHCFLWPTVIVDVRSSYTCRLAPRRQLSTLPLLMLHGIVHV